MTDSPLEGPGRSPALRPPALRPVSLSSISDLQNGKIMCFFFFNAVWFMVISSGSHRPVIQKVCPERIVRGPECSSIAALGFSVVGEGVLTGVDIWSR